MKPTKYLPVAATLALAGTLFAAGPASADSIGCRTSIHQPGNLPLCRPDPPTVALSR